MKSINLIFNSGVMIFLFLVLDSAVSAPSNNQVLHAGDCNTIKEGDESHLGNFRLQFRLDIFQATMRTEIQLKKLRAHRMKNLVFREMLLLRCFYMVTLSFHSSSYLRHKNFVMSMTRLLPPSVIDQLHLGAT